MLALLFMCSIASYSYTMEKSSNNNHVQGQEPSAAAASTAAGEAKERNQDNGAAGDDFGDDSPNIGYRPGCLFRTRQRAKNCARQVASFPSATRNAGYARYKQTKDTVSWVASGAKEAAKDTYQSSAQWFNNTFLPVANDPKAQLVAGFVSYPYAGAGPFCSALIGAAPNYLSSDAKSWLEQHPTVSTVAHAASAYYNTSTLEALVFAKRGIQQGYTWWQSPTRNNDLQHFQTFMTSPDTRSQWASKCKDTCVQYVQSNPDSVRAIGSVAASLTSYELGITGPWLLSTALINNLPRLLPPPTKQALDASGVLILAHMASAYQNGSKLQVLAGAVPEICSLLTAQNSAASVNQARQQINVQGPQANAPAPSLFHRMLPSGLTDVNIVRQNMERQQQSEIRSLQRNHRQEVQALSALLLEQSNSLNNDDTDDDTKEQMDELHNRNVTQQELDHQNQLVSLQEKHEQVRQELAEAEQTGTLTEFAVKQYTSAAVNTAIAPLRMIPNAINGEIKGAKMKLGVQMSEVTDAFGAAKRNFLDLIKNPTKVGLKTAGQWIKGGLLTSAAFGGLALAKYALFKGIDYAYFVVTNLAQKPKLFLESSQKGYGERVLDIFTKNKCAFSEMIFSADQEENFGKLLERIKLIAQRIARGENVTFPGILAYGPPGTGKTMGLSRIARESGLGFVILSGSSLAPFIKNGTAITELTNLFFYINFISPRPVMIYIDEADSLLKNRDLLLDDKSTWDAVNHLLQLTGTPSNKFVLALSTNYKDHLDPAIIDRVSDYIHVGLADTDTRRRLLDLYLNTIMYRRMNGKAFVKKAKELFTKEYIMGLAQKTEGFSNRSIQQFVSKIHSESLIAENGLVSTEIVDRAVKQMTEKTAYLQKLQKMKEFKMKQKELEAEWHIGSLTDKIAERDKQVSGKDTTGSKPTATTPAPSKPDLAPDKATIQPAVQTAQGTTSTPNEPQEQASATSTPLTTANATMKGKLFSMLGRFRPEVASAGSYSKAESTQGVAPAA